MLALVLQVVTGYYIIPSLGLGRRKIIADTTFRTMLDCGVAGVAVFGGWSGWGS